MPITDTLRNAEDLRRVGFTEEQARMLAEKYEETAHAQSEDLKAFFVREMDRRLEGLESRLRSEINDVRSEINDVRGEVKDLRAEMYSLARDQTLKFVSILIAALTLAVAVIKLFPNMY